MANKKLNTVVAVRKNVTARNKEEQTKVYRTIQTAALFEGFAKKYTPLDDKGEKHPDENKKVQFNMEERLKSMADLSTEVYDIELTTDAGNGLARADLIVEGKTLGKDIPATTYLYLEKQLTEFRNSIMIAPELPSDEDWTYDKEVDVYKAEPRQTHRTSKEQLPIVKYEATEKHPAQTEMITKDIVIGHWEAVKHHGGLPKKRKQELLRRVGKLIDAVNTSRELANMTEVPEQKIGGAIFDYLLAPDVK